jgi:hypothetical protein
LYELIFNPVGPVALGMKAFQKKAALVTEASGLDQPEAGDACLIDVH